MRDVERERERLALNQLLRQSDITWHGLKLNEPDWRPSSHSIAFTARPQKEGALFHVILNAYWEPLSFQLPPSAAGGRWRRWIDTFLDSPQDIVAWERAPAVAGNGYQAQPRSVVLLFTGVDSER